MAISSLVFYPSAAVVAVVVASVCVWYTRPSWVVRCFMRWWLYRSGLTIKFIRAGDYHFCYGERGSVNQKPSLVLVHGFSASKDMYVPIVKKLPQDIHIVVMDLPGHGDTSVPGENDEFTFVKYSEYLHQFIEAVGLQSKPFHLAGASMGGAIAGLYAATYRDGIDRLTLICPAMRTPIETDFHKEVRGYGKCRLIPETAEEFQTMLDACCFHKTKLNKQILQGFMDLRKPKQLFFQRLFDEIRMLDNIALGRELEEKTKEITVPTQVIWGKHDELIHVSGVELLQQRLPNCVHAHILDNCGHSCNMDRPGLVTKHILNFHNETFKKD